MSQGRFLQADEILSPYQQPQLVTDADGFSGEAIQRLSVSSKGTWLAAAAGKVIRVWNLKTNASCYIERLRGALGYHLGDVDCMAFSPDEQFSCRWRFR
ncbi:MAG: hypothetical protein U0936_18380 [Planctomycetaceae bacterium]